jgi:4-carboxymuconolactone decarboxylase
MAANDETEKANISERAEARGNELWNEAFTQRIAKEMAEWDPQFGELFMNYTYGGLYDRNVLPQKTRELCAVAACVMANATPQLRTHIFAAHNCGATKQEIMETILQMVTYCGAPYTIQAARIAHNEVFPAIDQGQTAPGQAPQSK